MSWASACGPIASRRQTTAGFVSVRRRLPPCGIDVVLLDVVAHHSRSRKPRRELREAGAYLRNPARRDTANVTIEKERNDFAFEQGVQLLGVGFIVRRLLVAFAERPAGFGRVCFIPPAVE